MPNSRPNPYVGPRSFQTGEKMYGRERETLELLDLLIAERIVLLYSPSGAGKTSLIQAALVPQLRAEGFNVLPSMRVNAEPPNLPPPPGAGANARPFTVANRFVFSLLQSLEEKIAPEKRLALSILSRLTFDEYLAQRADLGDTSAVLILDQFEEILTLDPTNLESKSAFFQQIGDALKNRERWALFSMREDYLAGLDPYVKPVPTRFATTYRLDLLGVNAAREAIQKPARNGGVNFTDAAADKLINDLRQVHVQRPDGTMQLQPGLYVEPVQLQVVCLRLWNNIPQTKNEIVESDIADVGDVNSALASYYELRVLAVAAATGESERAIREWFDRQLITEQGIRGQVAMEPERSRGLSNAAIRLFEDAHLVRADERRGVTWFELAHDRLLEPVRASNRAWFQENLSALQRQADLWNQQGRPDGLLLRGKALTDAETWAQQHSNEMTPTEQAFLSECRQARLIREKEQKQNRRIRFLAIGATVLSAIALLGILATLLSLNELGSSLEETDAARATAVANEQVANEQKQAVAKQDRVAKMLSASLSQLDIDPEVSLLVATEAFSTTRNIRTDDALRQALNASRVRGTLRGHTASVNAVAVSPDGKTFATASDDNTVNLWDASNGKRVRTLKNFAEPLRALTYSLDGKFLAAAGQASAAGIWDLSACKQDDCPFQSLQGHSGTVWSIAFSPDGARVATGGDDQTAKLWNASSGALERTLSGHAGPVYSVTFSPDGSQLLTTSGDQTARLWGLGACAESCPFQSIQSQAALWSGAFSPNGRAFVLASDDQNAYQYDRDTLSITHYLSGHNDAVRSASYSPDGKYIATGSRDGTARIWDALTGQTNAILRGHADAIWSAAFSPDSQLLLTGSQDQTAKLWSATDSMELRVLRGHLNKVLGANYSGDGSRIITVSADNTARIWDVATGTLAAPPLIGHTNWLADGALNQDGTRAATASYDNTARVWDLTRCNAQVEGEQTCASFDIQGHTDAVIGVTYSPDGNSVLTASLDRTAQIWDAQTGAHKLTLQGHDGAVNHAFYSPDGKWIVTSSADQTARIWDAATGEQKFTFGHSAAVNDATFSADGKLVVTASDDRTAQVWNVGDALAGSAPMAQKLLELRGHIGPVTAAVFSHDGKFIATGSSDKTARVWDAATGQEISALRGHTDKIQTVALSPDDRFLLTSSSDKTARVALVNIAEVFALAPLRVTRALSCDEWQTILREPNLCPGGGIAPNAGAYPTLAPITRAALVRPTQTLEPTIAPAPETLTPPATSANPALSPTARATADLSQPSGGGGGILTTSPTPTQTATLAATPTRALAPGIYVSKITYLPSNPPNFQFKVNFLNTTGKDFHIKWLVPFFEPGRKNSVGAPIGSANAIPAGASGLLTKSHKVNVIQCISYTAKVMWEDESGRQTQFLMTNGRPASIPFQICP